RIQTALIRKRHGQPIDLLPRPTDAPRFGTASAPSIMPLIPSNMRRGRPRWDDRNVDRVGHHRKRRTTLRRFNLPDHDTTIGARICDAVDADQRTDVRLRAERHDDHVEASEVYDRRSRTRPNFLKQLRERRLIANDRADAVPTFVVLVP